VGQGEGEVAEHLDVLVLQRREALEVLVGDGRSPRTMARSSAPRTSALPSSDSAPASGSSAPAGSTASAASNAPQLTILEECWRPAFARSLIPKITALSHDLAEYLNDYNYDRAHMCLTQIRVPADIVGAREN
jgi:hypothetical protein